MNENIFSDNNKVGLEAGWLSVMKDGDIAPKNWEVFLSKFKTSDWRPDTVVLQEVGNGHGGYVNKTSIAETRRSTKVLNTMVCTTTQFLVNCANPCLLVQRFLRSLG